MTQHTRASTSPEPGGAGSDFSFQAPNLSKLATGDQEEGEVLEEKQHASMPEEAVGQDGGSPGNSARNSRGPADRSRLWRGSEPF